MARKKKRSSKPAGTAKPRQENSHDSGPDLFGRIIRDLTIRLYADPADIQTRLELAECFNANGLETEIPNLLLRSESGYPFNDQLLNGQFDRLLAIGYAHQRKLVEAEETLKAAIESYPDVLDLWYTQSYVKLSLKEHKSTIEAGNKYLELWQDASANPHPIGMSCHTSRHKSQLLNFVGCAYEGEDDLEQAKLFFDQAIKADSENHHSYLNLINLLISTGFKTEARKIVESGLASCNQVHELKMIAKTLIRDFSISACLMVKNEEAMLPQCLESIRSWVDEIVLVDTGSTDKTIEIAKSYGAKIFYQPWEGSFSKHRNYTMEKATCDWILIIDADEMMVAEDIPLLLKVMSEPICEIVSLNVINVYGDRKNRSVFLPSVRLFKRELGVHYEGIVHNQIKTPKGVPVVRAKVRLEHYGYDLSEAKMKQKADRSRALLLKQLDSNPDHAFAHFNLGQLVRTGPDETIKERSAEVILHASKAVELTDPDIPAERFIHLMSLDQLAWSHFYLKQHDLARQFCRQALLHKPDYLDPLILLGHVSLDQGKLDQAENEFQEYLSFQAKYDMTAETDNLIINHIDGRLVAWYAMACISMLRGDTQAAIERFDKVLRLDDLYLETNGMLGQLYLRQNDLELAEKHLLRQINDGPESPDAHLWLGDLYLRQKKTELAERFYRQASALPKETKRGRDRLIRLYSDTDQLDKLTKILKEASIGWTDEPAEGITLAERLAAQGKYEPAIYIYERLVADGHASGASLNDLGNAYYRLSNLEKAAECYRLALETSDCPAVCPRNLAVVLVAMKRHPEALQNLKKYLEIQTEAVEEYQLAGDLSFQIEDYSGALGYYEAYLAKTVATPSILHQVSECYLMMGHKDAAILGFQRVIALEAGFQPALERLRQLKQPIEQT